MSKTHKQIVKEHLGKEVLAVDNFVSCQGRLVAYNDRINIVELDHDYDVFSPGYKRYFKENQPLTFSKGFKIDNKKYYGAFLNHEIKVTDEKRI